MPLHPITKLVAVSVDLGAEDLDIVDSPAPKRPQEVAEEDVLQRLLPGARVGGMHRAGDLLVLAVNRVGVRGG